ncbi:MAG TPA: hypothetical protein VF268_01160 [Gammaproteobacteria bacterium]
MGHVTRKLAFILAIAHFLSACATAPDRIKAHPISADAYASYNCEQLADEMQRIDGAAARLISEQQSAADTDDILVFVGIVLFWPAFFGLSFTDNYALEIAQVKGEQQAARQQWASKGCSKPA